MFIIQERKIFKILAQTKLPQRKEVLRVILRAKKKRGLNLKEVGVLVNCRDEKLIKEMFKVASQIKDEIYGERLVLFAPLYLSNFCVNDCQYCGFRCSNKKMKRKRLSLEEVRQETEILLKMGHKRILLEASEHPELSSIDYIVECIKTIYGVKDERGNNIRRINVNVAATSVKDYKKLKAAKIGTYQLFQETYHRKTYEKLHSGPKADFERQIITLDRAFQAGLDDLGMGVLFGLYDWKFEVLALISHAQYLDRTYGVGPHTISVPRWKKALGVSWRKAPYQVSDADFLKIVAILRMAIPYTGMIISTREPAWLRKKAFEIGISQTSAASQTSPGGYSQKEVGSQFKISDERSLAEVLKGVLKQGLLPSFCTACYRSDRTGEDFMSLAKSGKIHTFCRPNALLTFMEYLEDYPSKEIKKMGQKVIEKYLTQISDPKIQKETKIRLKKIQQGQRDLYF